MFELQNFNEEQFHRMAQLFFKKSNETGVLMEKKKCFDIKFLAFSVYDIVCNISNISTLSGYHKIKAAVSRGHYLFMFVFFVYCRDLSYNKLKVIGKKTLVGSTVLRNLYVFHCSPVNTGNILALLHICSTDHKHRPT